MDAMISVRRIIGDYISRSIFLSWSIGGVLEGDVQAIQDCTGRNRCSTNEKAVEKRGQRR